MSHVPSPVDVLAFQVAYRDYLLKVHWGQQPSRKHIDALRTQLPSALGDMLSLDIERELGFNTGSSKAN